MAHTVNFGQKTLVEMRVWESVVAAPNQVNPADVLIRNLEGKADDYLGVIRNEVVVTAKLLLEVYPKWKALLNDLSTESGSLA